MRTPEGNAAVELHDSEVVAIETRGGRVTITLAGYVHRSSGRPGVDPGSGWSQDVVLSFSGGTVQDRPTLLPVYLSDGSLTTGGGVLENVIAVPSVHQGPVHMELICVDDQRIVVTGDSIELSLVGEPTYVDEFTG